MKSYQSDFRIKVMCRVLQARRSGFYAWLAQPRSKRKRSDQWLVGPNRQSWLESGAVYGHRKVTRDLRGCGQRCSCHWFYRLMRIEGLRAQVGYGRRPRPRGSKPSNVTPNLVNRQFYVTIPNTHWFTEITYSRTHEGSQYLATVMDLYSRKVVGWATQGQPTYGSGAAGPAGGGVAAGHHCPGAQLPRSTTEHSRPGLPASTRAGS